MTTRKLEDISVFYEKNTHYEFTINACDQYQYVNKPLRNLKHKAYMRDLLISHLDPYAKYYLWCEVSEPQYGRSDTPFPRLHYHGIVYFTHPVPFLVEGFYKLQQVSSIQFNPFDQTYWLKYMHKQKHLSKGYLEPLKNISLKSLLSFKPPGEGPSETPERSEGRERIAIGNEREMRPFS